MHVREHVWMTDAECILSAWTARGGVMWPDDTEPRRLIIGGITVEEAFKAMRLMQFPNADAFRNAIQVAAAIPKATPHSHTATHPLVPSLQLLGAPRLGFCAIAPHPL